MTFPSHAIAECCVDYVKRQCEDPNCPPLDIVDVVPKEDHEGWLTPFLRVSIVSYPLEALKAMGKFWTHVGEGASGRRAEYMLKMFDEGHLVSLEEFEQLQSQQKGPKRYRKPAVLDTTPAKPAGDGKVVAHAPGVDAKLSGSIEEIDRSQFVEERFGRNLSLTLAQKAKHAIKRRIAGTLTSEANLSDALDMEPDLARARPVAVEDVYLYPTGMSSIFNTHRTLLACRGQMKSIVYGFPYVDTSKVLEKFGPGSLFLGDGSKEELDELEERLEKGERYLALFCEFPSNPLLRAPDVARIKHLADKYDFAVVIDETIGNFLNVTTLPYADIQVSSLTKIFSGDGNVMGGR